MSDAVAFIDVIASIVSSFVNALGPAWDFIMAAVTIMFVLAIFKQIGYRNGD